jgi:membrane protein YdbS with pleckstrin-like domain
MDPTRRLLFWLKLPYAADVALGIIGVGLLIAADPVGWWVLLFAAVRAVVGTVALVWIAPKMIADRAAQEGHPPEERPR